MVFGIQSQLVLLIKAQVWSSIVFKEWIGFASDVGHLWQKYARNQNVLSKGINVEMCLECGIPSCGNKEPLKGAAVACCQALPRRTWNLRASDLLQPPCVLVLIHQQETIQQCCLPASALLRSSHLWLNLWVKFNRARISLSVWLGRRICYLCEDNSVGAGKRAAAFDLWTSSHHHGSIDCFSDGMRIWGESFLITGLKIAGKFYIFSRGVNLRTDEEMVEVRSIPRQTCEANAADSEKRRHKSCTASDIIYQALLYAGFSLRYRVWKNRSILYRVIKRLRKFVANRGLHGPVVLLMTASEMTQRCWRFSQSKQSSSPAGGVLRIQACVCNPAPRNLWSPGGPQIEQWTNHLLFRTLGSTFEVLFVSCWFQATVNYCLLCC